MPSRKNDPNDENYNIAQDKSFKRQLTNLNSMIGQANLHLYGTDRTSDVDTLNTKFQSILQNKIGDITNRSDGDITSFLGQIVSSDNKNSAADEILNNQFMSMTGDEYSTMQSFIYDAYRNRLLEQSDLHEVSSQLIELSEAILIARDAIISADVVEGRMSRTLKFNDIDDEDAQNYISVVENMETKFKLLEKIKNFVVPKTLEYGEYYAYIVPYAKLFDDFTKSKNKDGYTGRMYRESTLMESFEEPVKNIMGKEKKNELNEFINATYEKYNIQSSTRYGKDSVFTESVVSKEDFTKDMKNMMGNITVCNDNVPLPILEEGLASVEVLKEFVEHGEGYFFSEDTKKDVQTSDLFSQVANGKQGSEGIVFSDDKKNKKKNEFSDIKDCYVKMIEPTKIIPVKIMNTIIGYYYVQVDDITPLSGAVSSTLYYTKFDENRKETTVIDALAERVVKSFDKPFLMNNLKFKEAIVDCINYYNINEKRLKFQFITPEYIQTFKIDEDVDGNGQSMIKKSLFYAKLYLMILLFKIMSIILNSNDQKVNYVKQSGIDKNVANKVQEIARIKQSRQINITDLFSYTTLINKVGNGTEMYIPTGRSGERPIETEILSGQDIQLNSDLLEMLKNAYILGTGVPAAIVNYLNEAEFAKQIEQNNTKFNGRVVNYQLDFNPSITEMYKKIMRWATNIPENIIENFEFTLQPPKSTAVNTKSEMIQQFTTLCDFLVTNFFDDPAQSMEAETLQKQIKEFKKLLIKDQFPTINFDDVMDMINEANLNVIEQSLKPNPGNGDNGDDDGLEEDLNNMNV